jgi:hypothetical protein
MASDRHSRLYGFLDHQRRVLPYSADMRDVPTTELLGTRYWSDDTAAQVVPVVPDRQRAEMEAGSGSRGWVFYELAPSSVGVTGPSNSAPPPLGAPILGAQFLAAAGVVPKVADPESPSGFSYKLSLRSDNVPAQPSYIMRTGTIFLPPGSDRAWVYEEAVLVVTVDDLNPEITTGTLDDTFPANFYSVGRPRITGYAFYSVPAEQVSGDNLFEPATGWAAPRPPPRPDAPIIYAVTKASGPWKYASNLVLSYDPVTTEREVAILRGVVGD